MGEGWGTEKRGALPAGGAKKRQGRERPCLDDPKFFGIRLFSDWIDKSITFRNFANKFVLNILTIDLGVYIIKTNLLAINLLGGYPWKKS
jgi:hypothetical protein